MSVTQISFNMDIARKCGVSAAVIASFIRNELIFGENNLDVMERYGDLWLRCSQRRMSCIFPFLTADTAASAINKLRSEGIIKKDCLNENKFDHTNWYAFTPYGWNLLKHDQFFGMDDDLYIDDWEGDKYDDEEDFGAQIDRIIYGC